MQSELVVYHIPVCPFSQRLEILLELKGKRDAVRFSVVDITRPRDAALLELSRGSTALPIMQTAQGVLKESLVILRYLDELFQDAPVARSAPYERAIESMLIAMEGDFTGAGYRFVMNQDRDRRAGCREAMIAQYRRLNDFLEWHNPAGAYLFDGFGLAEAVFTPLFMRFWFLDYYEDFDVAELGLERVRRWRDACLIHPAVQQVCKEEIVKLYYDYAMGAGNGALLPGRQVSSFAFEPRWQDRPWPSREKYGLPATDLELGLSAS
ncbi:glutathione S-transferase family protein [Pseudaminobacter soli (ex Li et al. 2025)]|uniref:Glutathione S-transferase family protein n=1 Tax=Pseudaminobacter soli (ex Li et al. 2025) TaxID=1295366 RepID=A0A2P7S2F2_9HYPH|nr:glutathione S-transferase family protein [Mesorhizobium soli]PSJ56645.1 glutathione S-transferase family protein [Mesorhizobium soli]